MRIVPFALFIAILQTSWSADLTGRWRAQFATPEGPPGGIPRDWTFSLISKGDVVEGYFSWAPGDDPIIEGKVTGDDIRMVVRVTNLSSAGRLIEFPGKILGEEIRIKSDYGPGGYFTMRRVSKDTPPPMPALPAPNLPVLRDLPDNKLARTPPMGWNSWNHFHRNVSDKIVREIADAMVSSGMKKAGYLYVNIDDGWEGQRDAQGNITSNEKFPDMKALADYVHSKGLKLGIYSSPGPRTCQGFEGSYNHEEQDAKTFAAWGIDYLKYDWCSAGRAYKETDMPAVYQKMGAALQATGRPIVYSLCQYGRQDVWKWGARAGGNLWRTTSDIGQTWKWVSALGFDKQQGLEQYAGPGHWNDPDMLEVGKGMTDEEDRVHFSLWAILAAPLLAGNDLRNMSAATRETLTNSEVIAVDQDKLGKQGSRISKNGDVEVWARPLSGGEWAIGLFNRGTVNRRVEVTWKELGATGPFKLRDLWAHASRGTHETGYSADVTPHGVIMLRASH